MEKARSQLKRSEVNLPFKKTSSNINIPKRKLSLRSENITITDDVTSRTKTPKSLFCQGIELGKKHRGKENVDLKDHISVGTSLATIAKSTSKRAKSSNSTNLYCITDSEKKIIRRRLSSDYEDRSSSSQFLPAKPIPFIIFPPKSSQPSAEVNVTKIFSIYNDGTENKIVEGKNVEAETIVKTPIIEEANSSSQNEETSRGKFLIERVDWTPPKNSFRRVKSGSDIGRLNIAVRKGEDISPLKRRMNQLKKSWKNVGQSLQGSSKKDPVVIRNVDISNSKIPTGVSGASTGAIKKTQSSQKMLEKRRLSKELIFTDEEIFSGEFHIEKVDRNYSELSSMNNINGGNKSRLSDTIVLKRRINQLKESETILLCKSRRINERGSASSLHGRKKEKNDWQKLTQDPFTPGIKSIIKWPTDYAKESIDIEYERDKNCHKISDNFLEGKIVTPEQRRIVVNFLISIHAYLSTSPGTVYQATRMFDAILDIKDVSVNELQLVALGVSWIAIKNMETRVPSASEMISFARDMYHAEGPGLLCKCERKILTTIDFNIRYCDPFHISAYYLHRCSSFGIISDEPSILQMIENCAAYLMDVALLDENYSGIPGQLLAVSATHLAIQLTLNYNTWWENSTEDSLLIKEKLTRYTQKEINRVASPLLKGVLDSAVKDSPISAVYKKYKTEKYNNTSDYLVVKIKKIYEGDN